MRPGSRHIRKLIAELDAAGVTVNILRAAAKRYELHVNFEVIKAFKTRRACNRRVIKLHVIHSLKK